jgi:phosphopentomutase
MSRVVLVLLDGLGVGAMRDVPEARPRDVGADSLAHALAVRPAELPSLVSLGLGHAAPSSGLPAAGTPRASWGRSELGYPGADSYLGHQVLMGSDVSSVTVERFAADIDVYAERLRDAGHAVDQLDGRPVLVVDQAMVVADSLEADPGMNYNVTGSLEQVAFDQIVSVARVVRDAAPVPRIIAVGGTRIRLPDVIGSLEERDGVVGVDTPGLGVYDEGVELLHLGHDFGFEHQAPSLVAALGLPVTLVGKMADMLACEGAQRLPGVETSDVLSSFEDVVSRQADGLVAVNVQELDLAGHRESCEDYVRVLERSDESIGRVLERLSGSDLLIVTGDHGDDPARGPLHTREEVPLLAYSPGGTPRPLGLRRSLADVGATIAHWLGAPGIRSGESFAGLVR